MSLPERFNASPAFRKQLLRSLHTVHEAAFDIPLTDAAGGVVIDSAGRVLLREPTNHFGGLCVPLDTQILTRRGWLAHDKVQVGDETIGFDPEVGHSRWTKVTHIHHPGTQATVLYGNTKLVSVRCTPKHTWVTSQEVGGAVVWGLEQAAARKKHAGGKPPLKTVFATPHLDDTGSSDVTPDEAAVLGWIVTDGHLSKVARRVTCWECGISQTKPKGIAHIDALFTRMNFPHTKDVDYGDMARYRLHAHGLRKLLKRTGYSGTKDSLLAVVLRMSHAALQAFFDAVYTAEGSMADTSRKCLWQNNGPCLDALQVAAYRLGHFPVIRKTGKSTVNVQALAEGRALVLQKLSLVHPAIRDIWTAPSTPCPVWCVTTELGTWTMRQGPHVCLTGNSWTFAKGTQDPGEEVTDTAAREILEETGVTVKVGKRLGAYYGSTSKTVMFLCTPIKIGREHDKETKQVGWFIPEEAVSNIAESTNATSRKRDLTILKHAIEKDPRLQHNLKALRMIGNLLSGRVIE
jgi:8-oxo-dGTP pyrophosphatase MutT (NUDIX family)